MNVKHHKKLLIIRGFIFLNFVKTRGCLQIRRQKQYQSINVSPKVFPHMGSVFLVLPVFWGAVGEGDSMGL